MHWHGHLELALVPLIIMWPCHLPWGFRADLPINVRTGVPVLLLLLAPRREPRMIAKSHHAGSTPFKLCQDRITRHNALPPAVLPRPSATQLPALKHVSAAHTCPCQLVFGAVPEGAFGNNAALVTGHSEAQHGGVACRSKHSCC